MPKFTLPTPLRQLTDDHLAELHAWFTRHTYPQILALLRDRFGIEMSKTQLCRYHQKFTEAQLFNAVLHTPLTPADMLAIRNAEPIPDYINRDELKKQCLRLAHLPGLRGSDLKQLFDVFTYEDRHQMAARAQMLRLQELDLREQFQEYRRQLHAQRSADAAGT